MARVRSSLIMALFLLALFLLVLPDVSKAQESFDLLIRGARVLDGTGNPWVYADVGIRDGRIVAVGPLTDATAARVLDVEGKVLTPGFIDTHSHHDGRLLELRDATAAVSQGITTIVVGQDGGSNFPLSEFFEALEATPASVNVASYVGHGRVRRTVLGDDYRRPATDAEVAEMLKLVRRELDAGALGLSTGLEYDPGIYSETEEVIALARVTAAYGGRYISHMRSEDRSVFEAVDELIRIGRETGMPVQISHMKLAMKSLWGQADRLIAVLDQARASGVDVTADVYPYEYWQSTMTVLFPGREYTREAAAFALDELAPPEGMLIGRFEPQPEYVGLTLAEIAETRGTDAITAYLDLIAESQAMQRETGRGAESIIATSMATEDVIALMAWEHSNVSSDGALAGRHPRGFGSFTRVLGRFVRERQAMTLEQAVHKMTGLAAEHMGLRDRGLVEVGAVADLVLFDPESVLDRATPEQPQLVSTGVERVWVAGEEVFVDGAATGVHPGVVIRREGALGRSATARLPASMKAGIDSIFSRYDNTRSPGCALGVVQDGELSFGRGYGMANLEHGRPITTSSIFRIGSVSKQFTAAAVALAAARGELSLDDPVREHIPELPDFGPTFTIRHLIHHTSGVRDYLTLMSLTGRRGDDYYTDEEVLEILSRQKELNFEPGAEFLYSNAGYFLLSQVILRATGRSLREYAQEVLFEPLAMPNSHFHDDHRHIVPLRATGYSPTGDGSFRINVTTLDMVGDGGVFTSVEDLVPWVGNFADPRVGGAELIRTLETRGVLNGGESIPYAFGIGHGEHRGLRTISHGGAFVGYRADITRYPDHGLDIITLCNLSSASPSALARAVGALVLADRMDPPAESLQTGRSGRQGERSESDWSPDDPSEFVGEYWSDELLATYRIVEEADGLQVRAGRGIDLPLVPSARDTFNAGRLVLRFQRRGDKVVGLEVDAGRVQHVKFERRTSGPR